MNMPPHDLVPSFENETGSHLGDDHRVIVEGARASSAKAPSAMAAHQRRRASRSLFGASSAAGSVTGEVSRASAPVRPDASAPSASPAEPACRPVPARMAWFRRLRPGSAPHVNPTLDGGATHGPQATTPKQLFVHELQDVYYAEKPLTTILPKLASQASDGELTRAFQTHLKETRAADREPREGLQDTSVRGAKASRARASRASRRSTTSS